ncbi:hypothetical protein GPECTOR_30g271 [Gonium pectorale]|uniref:Amidinotransferase n=1 Tax=Gonium pectorale TaxID=33097 RepID=A0A150GF25_GONPE|nr:hypothetical protein GPECTOR_30g271 [Gonium pectorale]|eukprot:KXZ48175.1 hypothetical protein GPECTOR_30g271 [Gonium pectorale]
MLSYSSAFAAAPALAAAWTSGAMRALSSSAATLEAIALSNPDSPLLVRLPSRPWGAAASLTKAEVQAAAGPSPPTRIAVVRDSFAAFDEPQRPLSKLLRPLGSSSSSSVAVAAELASAPEARALVDVYSAAPGGEGGYRLESVATDLISWLRSQRQRVALVPDVGAAGLAAATPVVGASKGVRQSSNEVLMVAPTAFGFNEQAAQDNSFMHAAAKPGEGGNALTRQVLREFAGLHHALTQVAGVKVNLFEHNLAHGTPDACFPNNWFSTHPRGEAAGGVAEPTLVYYPMKCPNRAAERREDIIKNAFQTHYPTLDTLGHSAVRPQRILRVLVIDRINGVVYVDISERADRSLAEEWTQRMGYKELVAFRSTDLRGKSVYHTNVMMAIGTGVAIVCAESVQDAKERQHLLSSLRRTHEVVEISLAQMDSLCGNALELEDGRGLPVMAMSTQAYNAFTADQKKVLRRHCADLLHAPIDTLERVGGGGVRCTLAEIF